MVAAKKPHVGGQQLPLIVPQSDWRVPDRPPDLTGQTLVALDVETNDEALRAGVGPGWATGRGYVAGVALAWDGGQAYLPVRHPDTDNLDRDAVRACLEALYRSSARIVMHKADYDLGWVECEFGLKPPRGFDRVHDTMLAAFVANENELSFSLDNLCTDRGIPGKDETLLREAATAYCVDPKSEMWRLPARYVGPYAEGDVVATRLLHPCLMAEIDEQNTREAYDVEAELIACCVEMRRRGIRVDTLAIEQAQDRLLVRRDNLLAELTEKAGERVTLEMVRSWQAMARLCDKHGVEYPRTLKAEQPSFKADWMMRSPHWLPRLAEQVDRATNAVDKFMGNYLTDFTHRGRIHPSINQFLTEDENGARTGTRSHRFSYSGPPLQQAPGDKMAGVDDLGAEIVSEFRGALLPEEGEIFLDPDFSQQEYRMLVHWAYVSKLDKADEAVARYRDDAKTDYHTLVADLTGFTQIYGKKYGRRKAKDVNFAAAFGAGPAKFASMTNMTLDEAVATLSTYDTMMPFVKQLGEKCTKLARNRGYIRLIDGARMHYNLYEPAGWLERDEIAKLAALAKPFGDKVRWNKGKPRSTYALAQEMFPGYRLARADAHKSRNNLVQGSSARQTKRAMLIMWREGIVPLLQMHDAIPTSVSDKKTGERIAEIMRTAIPISVPMLVDTEYGISWGSAKKIEDKATGDVLYDASYESARRLQEHGPWW